MRGFLYFPMYLQGKLFGIALQIVKNAVICMMHLACIDQVKSYCLKELILPQDIRDFIENQFSNVVLSPFSTYYTQREVSEKAVTHFGDLGLMEEDVWEALGYMLLYLEDIIKSEISHINYVHQLSVGNRLILRYIFFASS